MDQKLRDLISRIPYTKKGGFYVRGRTFAHLSDACKYFNITEDVVIQRLLRGADIDMAFGGSSQAQTCNPRRNPFLKYIKSGGQSIEVPSTNTEGPIQQRKGKRPQHTFKMLKESLPHYATPLNKLHQWVDKYAMEKGATCFTVNALEKHWSLLHDTVTQRWRFLSASAVVRQINIEEIPDISQDKFTSNAASIIKQVETIKKADLAIISVPQHILASRLQVSLGSILRSRNNQNLPTLVFINHNFLFALESYDSYLSESFVEFGKRLYEIDVNYARVL